MRVAGAVVDHRCPVRICPVWNDNGGRLAVAVADQGRKERSETVGFTGVSEQKQDGSGGVLRGGFVRWLWNGGSEGKVGEKQRGEGKEGEEDVQSLFGEFGCCYR